MKPYEVVYGQQPLLVISYLPSTSKVEEMDSFLHSHDFTLASPKENLTTFQNHMKKQ